MNQRRRKLAAPPPRIARLFRIEDHRRHTASGETRRIVRHRHNRRVGRINIIARPARVIAAGIGGPGGGRHTLACPVRLPRAARSGGSAIPRPELRRDLVGCFFLCHAGLRSPQADQVAARRRNARGDVVVFPCPRGGPHFQRLAALAVDRAYLEYAGRRPGPVRKPLREQRAPGIQCVGRDPFEIVPVRHALHLMHVSSPTTSVLNAAPQLQILFTEKGSF